MVFVLAHPQRDMRRLHRLLNDRHQVLAQVLSDPPHCAACAKGGQRASRIILAAIEAAIDEGLDAMAQGLEERRNDEGRDHDSDRVILVEQPLEQRLQRNNEAKVQQGEQSRQAAIHQRTVDQHVDIVESIAQNREPNGERDQEKGDGEDDNTNTIVNRFPQRIIVVDGWDEYGYDEYAL